MELEGRYHDLAVLLRSLAGGHLRGGVLLLVQLLPRRLPGQRRHGTHGAEPQPGVGRRGPIYAYGRTLFRGLEQRGLVLMLRVDHTASNSWVNNLYGFEFDCSSRLEPEEYEYKIVLYATYINTYPIIPRWVLLFVDCIVTCFIGRKGYLLRLSNSWITETFFR